MLFITIGTVVDVVEVDVDVVEVDVDVVEDISDDSLIPCKLVVVSISSVLSMDIS